MADQKEQAGPVVVVGYDGKPGGREAVRVAAERAGPHGKLYIVYAFPPPSDSLGFPNYNNAFAKHEREAQEVLDQLLADAAELSGTDYVTKLLPGDSPAVTLADVASAHEADEIVVGSRPHQKVRDALGGVHHDLAHQGAAGDVPVTVVPLPS